MKVESSRSSTVLSVLYCTIVLLHCTVLSGVPNQMAAGRSFYAVREGRKPGIYSSWKECKNEVSGFANAIYKKFDTRKQAESFLADTTKKEAIRLAGEDDPG